MWSLLRRGEDVEAGSRRARTVWTQDADTAHEPLSSRRWRAAHDASEPAVPLRAVPALATGRLRRVDGVSGQRVGTRLEKAAATTPRRTSFIAHFSHASRQPHGTASKATGLPHLQVVTCACSDLTTAVAIVWHRRAATAWVRCCLQSFCSVPTRLSSCKLSAEQPGRANLQN
jgi:hypothetical protein